MENSAYVKLKAAKRPNESFSDVVHRVLGSKEPSFSDFRGVLSQSAVEQLADAIAKMREEDIRIQRKRIPSPR